MTQTKPINPLDELFQTASPAELAEYEETTEGELAAVTADTTPEKDAEDIAIDEKIDKVYDAAYETFQNQMAYVEMVEPRYAARNAEVAATYLNIALNAASTRAKVKGDRKRVATFVPFGQNTSNGGVVVANREEIMRMMSIDADTKEIK